MARLRDPQSGCPWDRQQSFESIVSYTIEEAYEVADAIQRGDIAALRDELGDLLFQVVFHCQMASEEDLFQFDDVVTRTVDKMVRRHPHVFAGQPMPSAEEQSIAWEQHKDKERMLQRGNASPSLMESVARGLPGLRRAMKLQKSAARVAFDWSGVEEVVDKLEEEIEELKGALASQDTAQGIAEEVGDLLFTCVNLARHLNVDPESALRKANHKFERRFRRMEQLFAEANRRLDESSMEEREAAWVRVKSEETGGPPFGE